MAQKLGESGYVVYEKYGRVSLTEKGLQVGKQLLYRHQLLVRFLRQGASVSIDCVPILFLD
jgi:Mn-dependent DtxR family transcriptional regulator